MKLFKYLVFMILIGSGCGTDIETISIQREGILTFRVDGYDEKWRSHDFTFFPGQSVVKAFDEDDEVVTELFRRFYLVFEGTSPDNIYFELSVALDIADEKDMRHVYRNEYSQGRGGLHSIILILTDNGSSPIYQMAEVCDDALDHAYFEIDRQSTTERLIAGSFAVDLCFSNLNDSIFSISDVEFKDIEY